MKLEYIYGQGLDPYRNLAVEQYLLENVPEDTCILYLWQNDNTVVIGRNQNCWKECRTEEIKRDGCVIARRLSGGGAVFHDRGNLNFTFLVNSKDYDLDKQLSVIAEACRKLGLDARPTGRNDITVDGRKFSGNAFYQAGDKRYHHGTILVSADMARLAGYLNVSEDKLKSKGVSSVKARVVNLGDLNAEITVEKMRTALIDSFGEIYGGVPVGLSLEGINRERIDELALRNASWDWVYGRDLPFTFEMSGRYTWGGVEIKLEVVQGVVDQAVVYSDMMEWEAAEKIAAALKGCRFDPAIMADAVAWLGTEELYADVAGLILEQEV